MIFTVKLKDKEIDVEASEVKIMVRTDKDIGDDHSFETLAFYNREYNMDLSGQNLAPSESLGLVGQFTYFEYFYVKPKGSKE